MTTTPALRVLVVEDEPLIAMEIEAVLEDAGHVVAGAMASVGAALDYLDRERPDAALIDVNVRGESIYPVADRLANAQIPFLVLTGHSRESLPERLRPFFHGKPFKGPALMHALEKVAG